MAAPDRAAFIQSLTPLAQQWEARTGIPASYWLAIAASESNWGAAGNSLFGIKGSGTAGSLNSPTWESQNGQRVNTNADFAAYNKPDEAFQAFWNLVSTSPRYADAVSHLPNDPQGFLQGINKAGYATDPKWASTIQNLATTTITPMMTAGGQTMAQQKDGTPTDTSAVDDAINTAINGDLGSGAASPDQTPSDTSGAAPVDTGTATGGMDGNNIRDLIAAKIGPWVSRTVINPTTKDTNSLSPTYGKTLPNRQPTYRYVWADGKYLDIAALDSGAVVKGGTALATLATGTAPDTKTFPDGSLRQYDPDSKQWKKIADPPPDKAAPAPKTIKTADGSTYGWDPNSGQWSLIQGGKATRVQIHTMPDGSLQQYDPDTGQWTMIQPRYVDPAETAYKQALTAEAQANTQKTQMGLRPVGIQAMQDAEATIAAIKGQLASGKMSIKDAQSLMDEVHQGLAATLAGTTLFEQQKQAQATATQRAQIADSLLNQRVSSAASIGNSLFSAATGHVMLPKGQATLGIDPFQIANQEVNTMGGGQGTGDAAAAFLRSVFGGGGQNNGTNVQSSSSAFPMTREDVLAKYPELAQAGQPAAQPVTQPAQPQPQPVAAAPAYMPVTGRE